MMLVGSVSKSEVEVSICVGNTVVVLVELGGVVTISAAEVKTDNVIVGLKGTLLFGPISMHGVVGEVGTIVTDIYSGHGVVGETKTVGVVSIEETIGEDMIKKVFVVSHEEEREEVTEEEQVPAVTVCEEWGEFVEIAESIELALVEEREDKLVISDGEEEIMVLKK